MKPNQDEPTNLGMCRETYQRYLCKMDQFIRPLGVQEAQLIRRGERPKPEAKNRGAPRRRTMPTSQGRKRPEITGFAEAVDALGY